MTQPMTVLALTPSVGGQYFGELLAGLTREVAGARGRLVVVETLPAGAVLDEPGEPGDFATPVGWNQVDGVVSITTAVTAAYLQRLRDRGMPVVLSSTHLDGFAAPIAMPDNHGGTFAAVEHLIGHGHTRIGFVGNLGQPDVRDRLAAYRQALATYDLVADPALVFSASDNAETGGVRAARDLLAGPHRPSALMIATDRNAVGVMSTLARGGLVVPRDIAVVAFDNIEVGAFSDPALSSVNQRFDEVGALAGRLILAKIRGEDVPSAVFTSPSVVVAVRESCGCVADSPHGVLGGAPWLLDSAPEILRDELQDVLSGALLAGDGMVDGAMRDAVLAAVREAERLLRPGMTVTSADIRALADSLRRLTDRPDTLRRITDAMTEYVERVGASSGGPTVASARIVAMLWKSQAGALLRRAESTETAIQEQYVVDGGLLDAGSVDPRDLRWLTGTHVSAGALALWTSGPSTDRLEIVGVFDPAAVLAPVMGDVVTAEGFPPQSLIAQGAPGEGRVCVVVPVRTVDRDWGLLAVVGGIDTISVRETYQHWAALLCASLESQQLQEDVRESEERYALAARATKEGHWELNVRESTVFISDRCCALLGLEPGLRTEDRRAEWTAVLHPDDLAQLRGLLERVSLAPEETVDTEYRVRAADGTYRWMLSCAVGVLAADGTIARIVGSLADIDTRRSLEDQLRHTSMYDPLTGLPNRRFFLDRLELAVAQWQRSGTPFAVLFLDLDGFKAINDALGHPAGDRLLTVVGARLARELRAVDTGARFGGDEFAILLHDALPDDVLVVARRIQADLAELIDLDGHEITIQASVGIATSALEYSSAEDILRDADTAMYHAKAIGWGTVTFFDAQMHAHAVHQQLLQVDLYKAVEEDQFEVHYQPIVDLATGRSDRFEALVRWRHPERGLVPPGEFLPLLEETGLIVPLGRWIRDEVCRRLAEWGPGVANVAVNVANREFWHKDLLTGVLDSLHRHGLTTDRLTLEITEGVIMRRPEVALARMREMHDVGLALHIDDFGTGYSSLETLHRFPVEAFKIDRAFIHDLTTGERTADLVRAIVAMGKALGLAVIAEGIETDQHLTFLRDVGCVSGQGYLFTPAVTADQVPGVLGRVLHETRAELEAPQEQAG
ncbi:EAL domain-containing protein [Pengzhenrongella frigida]|uniref:EAL domain-containing protein n=1 Tax=Pengzhenrongella frigida TaxID=1259133 RepID=A0A4Q5MZI9_9MICO|nr:EAL domain-containing protein [Cellulomonas sp. HLT2-17]RYV51155.1 EAL domain-containing protein [Cellulomonas sp. HLT2-17]